MVCLTTFEAANRASTDGNTGGQRVGTLELVLTSYHEPIIFANQSIPNNSAPYRDVALGPIHTMECEDKRLESQESRIWALLSWLLTCLLHKPCKPFYSLIYVASCWYE